jgi:hypothetical protein
MAFSTYDPEKYATVTLKIEGGGNSHYILLLTDASGKTIQEKKGVTNGQYRFNYVSPGEIRLRIIEDKNGNGVWDAGDVLKGLQPERAESYFNERGEDLFTTKMNWDFEINIDMGKVFVPMTMENLVKMLDDKEESRLKKLYEEWQKKSAEGKGKDKHQHEHQGGGGMGFGGMAGGIRNATSTFN